MPNSYVSKIVIHPILRILLLLLMGVLWIGFVGAILFIPSPINIPYDQTYYSPLPGVMIAGLFNHFAFLLGWYHSYPDNIYNMRFVDNMGDVSIPLDSCGSYRVMNLQVKPISLFGSLIHVDAFEVTICGHSD